MICTSGGSFVYRTWRTCRHRHEKTDCADISAVNAPLKLRSRPSSDTETAGKRSCSLHRLGRFIICSPGIFIVDEEEALESGRLTVIPSSSLSLTLEGEISLDQGNWGAREDEEEEANPSSRCRLGKAAGGISDWMKCRRAECWMYAGLGKDEVGVGVAEEVLDGRGSGPGRRTGVVEVALRTRTGGTEGLKLE